MTEDGDLSRTFNFPPGLEPTPCEPPASMQGAEYRIGLTTDGTAIVLGVAVTLKFVNLYEGIVLCLPDIPVAKNTETTGSSLSP